MNTVHLSRSLPRLSRLVSYPAISTPAPYRRKWALNHARSSVRAFADVAKKAGAPSVAVEITDDGVQVKRPNIGKLRRQTLPHFWLRDNCRCAKCVNQDTMQRNFNTFEIPPDIKPLKVSASERTLDITWPDGHQSEYPWEFISFYQAFSYRGKEKSQMQFWGAEAAENPPTVSYGDIMSSDHAKGEQAVGQLTSKIQQFGFVFVTETPFDDAEHTRMLLERIAFIRQTHYGGFYDFTPNLAMADTAYTNLALPAHTDTTYFTDPAGLQAFHLLSHQQSAPDTTATSTTTPEFGGASLLVDGFHAARILEHEDPAAYKALSKVGLPWHASGNAGITIAPDRLYPVLELDGKTGALHRVRWNNDDRGVVPFDLACSPAEWYAAARKWDAILRRREVECWVQLEPGKTLIFDNWRVLHGRSAFTGIRRICGAYINRDDYISRWRNTNFSRNDILRRIVG